jgi:DNA end-binding protein Ku
MTAEFDPSQYKDEYREALETIIQAKVEGEETVDVEAPEESGKLIDLMAALEASVNAAKASRSEPTSVADAKAAKEAKAEKEAKATGARARTAKTASGGGKSSGTAAKAASDEEADGETRAKPAARKRKTA